SERSAQLRNGRPIDAASVVADFEDESVVAGLHLEDHLAHCGLICRSFFRTLDAAVDRVPDQMDQVREEWPVHLRVEANAGRLHLDLDVPFAQSRREPARLIGEA